MCQTSFPNQSPSMKDWSTGAYLNITLPSSPFLTSNLSQPSDVLLVLWALERSRATPHPAGLRVQWRLCCSHLSFQCPRRLITSSSHALHPRLAGAGSSCVMTHHRNAALQQHHQGRNSISLEDGYHCSSTV